MCRRLLLVTLVVGLLAAVAPFRIILRAAAPTFGALFTAINNGDLVFNMTGVPTGATVIVGIGETDAGNRVMTGVSDTNNGAYTLALGPIKTTGTDAPNRQCWIYYKQNVTTTAGALTVTADIAVAGALVGGAIWITGAATGVPTTDSAADAANTAMNHFAAAGITVPADSFTFSFAGASAALGAISQTQSPLFTDLEGTASLSTSALAQYYNGGLSLSSNVLEWDSGSIRSAASWYGVLSGGAGRGGWGAEPARGGPMTRWRLVLLLLVLAVAGVSGQERKLRARWVSSEGLNAAPSISIQFPDTDGAFETPEATIQVTGIADDDEGLKFVKWTCTTCTPESGTAEGLTTWDTGEAGSGSQVVGDDTFTEIANTDLDLHVPGIGAAWVELVDTSSGSVRPNRVFSGAQVIGSQSAYEGSYTITLLAPSPSLSGANYTVALDIANTADPGNDDGAGIIFGASNATNFCGLLWYGTTAATDLFFFQHQAGVYSVVGTPATNVNVITGDHLEVTVNGTALTATRNGVTVATATSTFCDDAAGVGVFFGGAITGATGADTASASRMDNFQVTDNGVSSGIGLSLGANDIDVTATDLDDVTTTVRLTVTRGILDNEGPVVTIQSPDPGTAYSTSTQLYNPSGTVIDNVLATSGSCACPTCTPTMRAMTITGGTWSVVGTFALGSNPNVVTCTATDAATNSGQDQQDVTYNAGDSTAPVATITTATGGSPGANFPTAASPVALAGTCTDNVAHGLNSLVTWVNAQGSNGNATGVDNWTASIPLAVGVNNISVTCRDDAGNVDATPDTIVVTLTTADLIISSTSMESAVQSAAYGPSGAGVQLQATGGTPPYTWREDPNGTTINDADAECGFTISSTGLVTGTEASVGTCNWTAHVTDSAGAPDTDTQPLAILVVASGGGGVHDYFNALVVRGDTIGSASLRGANHHKCPAEGGFATRCDADVDYSGAYDAAHDAMRITIPTFTEWYETIRVQFTTALNATDITSTPTALVYVGDLTGRHLLLPTGEIVYVTAFNSTTKIVTITRGLFGTTKATLAANTPVKVSTNGNSGHQPIKFAGNQGTTIMSTTDGNTYLFTGDVKFDSSYMTGAGGSGLTNYKAWTIRDGTGGGNKWYEIQTVFSNTVNSPCFVAGQTIASIRSRTYVGNYTGAATWADSNGAQAGPGVTNNSLIPGNNDQFCIQPSKWTRYWLRIEQRANDYDYISLWFADEDTAPFQVYNQVPLSLRGTGINHLNFEMGSSTKAYVRPSISYDLISWARNVWVGGVAGLASAGAFSDANMKTLMEQP